MSESLLCCSLCVDNVAGYQLTIGVKTGHTTGPVNICWPCLTGRLDNLQHDLQARLHGIPRLLGEITSFTVQEIKPLTLGQVVRRRNQ